MRDTDLLVIYGEGGGHGSVRVAWVLDVHGHRRVAVMPDGMRGWRERGGAITSEPPGLSSSSYRARLDGEKVANKLSVLHAISDSRVGLLDVRRGQADPSERSRQIPSSRRLGLAERLMCPANLEDLRELQEALLTSVGAGESLIVYSDTGVRASLVGLALRDVGRAAIVYDGGWNEWASHPGLPTEDFVYSNEPSPGIAPEFRPGATP